MSQSTGCSLISNVGQIFRNYILMEKSEKIITDVEWSSFQKTMRSSVRAAPIIYMNKGVKNNDG